MDLFVLVRHLAESRNIWEAVCVCAYLVIVRAAIRLLVQLVSRPVALPHHAVQVSHAAHIHTFVLHHPSSCLYGVLRRVSLPRDET